MDTHIFHGLSGSIGLAAVIILIAGVFWGMFLGWLVF